MHSVTVQPEEAPSFSVPCRGKEIIFSVILLTYSHFLEFGTVGKLREEIMKRLRYSGQWFIPIEYISLVYVIVENL